MIRALVMTHGGLGIELVRVTEMILGPVPGLTGLTNAGKSAPDIVAEVQRWLDEKPADGDEEDLRLILLDDYGGSCSTGAQMACKGDPNTAIISGVNLAMLLGFVTWRDSSDFQELAARIIAKGREAITLVGETVMEVVLARIDDRLIHGQVTVGWSVQLRPDTIILADNAIAADSWQSRVYASSVPPHITVSILSVARAAAVLAEPPAAAERVLLLTGGPSEMAELVRLGAPVRRVNVGGLHFAAGKREMLPFVYVDGQDLKALQRLLDQGVTLAAQQVPGGREFPLEQDDLSSMGALF